MQEIRNQEISVSDLLSTLLSSYQENEASFAVWKLPYSQTIQLASGRDPEEWNEVSLEEAKPGFIFSPFDPQKKSIFLPADEFHRFESGKLIYSKNELSSGQKNKASGKKHKPYYTSSDDIESGTTPQNFLNLIDKGREAVLNGTLEKIVPSRFKQIDLPESFDLVTTFNQLCELYPHAMVSMFSSPITGTWVGATPELLVSVSKNQHFHTVAVAGTQPFKSGTDVKSITWNQKDIEEQALVERYIISCFKKIRLREFEEYGPKTVEAGNVVHLKTIFDVDMVATNFPQLGTIMLKLLHPTSAVCGMPLEAGLKFLKENEGYEREYYSGYLGPLNIDQESHLYVNIRCMKLLTDTAVLFAGAGVLADSDPEKEWAETELKMNTLLKIIRP